MCHRTMGIVAFCAFIHADLMVLMPNKGLMAKKPHSLCPQWHHNSFIELDDVFTVPHVWDGRTAMSI
uniref:Secreted protein n=1 Tax=Arundo donax TaxID=35708 RepID=A0A0A9FZE0_ARUDO